MSLWLPLTVRPGPRPGSHSKSSPDLECQLRSNSPSDLPVAQARYWELVPARSSDQHSQSRCDPALKRSCDPVPSSRCSGSPAASG